MKEPNFPEILKAKRDYYGYTEAAIELAADEYARLTVEYDRYCSKRAKQCKHHCKPEMQ